MEVIQLKSQNIGEVMRWYMVR